VRPTAARISFFVTQPAAGLRRTAPFAATEIRRRLIVPTRASQPVARRATVTSPAIAPGVHFRHWRTRVDSPEAAAVPARRVTGEVYRLGSPSMPRDAAPVDLNRFLSGRHAVPIAADRSGAAPLDLR
jgi:hypothetical protein